MIQCLHYRFDRLLWALGALLLAACAAGASDLSKDEVKKLISEKIGGEVCLSFIDFATFPVTLSEGEARANGAIFNLLAKEGLLKTTDNLAFEITEEGKKAYRKPKDSGLFCYSDGYEVVDITLLEKKESQGREGYDVKYTVKASSPQRWILNPDIHKLVSPMGDKPIKSLTEPIEYRCAIFRKKGSSDSWTVHSGFGSTPSGMSISKNFAAF